MEATGHDSIGPLKGMPPRVRPGIFWVMVLFSAIGITCFFLRRATPVPIVVEVVEPIAVIDGGSYDDGGSRFIRFRDAAGITRYACLLNELDGNRNLVFEDQEVPLGGAEEHRFLALLQRWAASRREGTQEDAIQQALMILEELHRRNRGVLQEPAR